MRVPVSVALGRSLARAIVAICAALIAFWLAETAHVEAIAAAGISLIVALLVGRAVRYALLTTEERHR